MAITNGFLSRFFRKTRTQESSPSTKPEQQTNSEISPSTEPEQQTNSEITSTKNGRKVLTTNTPNPPRYTGGIFTTRDMFRFIGGGTPRDTSPTVVSGYTQSLQRRLGGISSSNRSLFSSGINNMANYFSSSRFFSWA